MLLEPVLGLDAGVAHFQHSRLGQMGPDPRNRPFDLAGALPGADRSDLGRQRQEQAGSLFCLWICRRQWLDRAKPQHQRLKRRLSLQPGQRRDHRGRGHQERDRDHRRGRLRHSPRGRQVRDPGIADQLLSASATRSMPARSLSPFPRKCGAVRGTEIGCCILSPTKRRSSCAGLTRVSTGLPAPPAAIAGVNGRNKSGHDDLKLRGHHCAFGSVRIGYFLGQPCVKGGIEGGKGHSGCLPVQARGRLWTPRFCRGDDIPLLSRNSKYLVMSPNS